MEYGAIALSNSGRSRVVLAPEPRRLQVFSNRASYVQTRSDLGKSMVATVEAFVRQECTTIEGSYHRMKTRFVLACSNTCRNPFRKQAESFACSASSEITWLWISAGLSSAAAVT